MARTFLSREPDEFEEYVDDLPAYVRPRGKMLRVGYKSDKWEPRHDEYPYVHEHEEGVVFYEKARRTDADAQVVDGWPRSWARLGSLWLLAFVDVDGGTEVEADIARGTQLLCSPDGTLLICLHPTHGFYGAIYGGRMRVGKDGIEN